MKERERGEHGGGENRDRNIESGGGRERGKEGGRDMERVKGDER